jgi:hypothetical protein
VDCFFFFLMVELFRRTPLPPLLRVSRGEVSGDDESDAVVDGGGGSESESESSPAASRSRRLSLGDDGDDAGFGFGKLSGESDDGDDGDDNCEGEARDEDEDDEEEEEEEEKDASLELEREEKDESVVLMLGRSAERRMLRRDEALVSRGPLFDGARLLSSSFTVSSFCASCTHVFPLMMMMCGDGDEHMLRNASDQHKLRSTWRRDEEEDVLGGDGGVGPEDEELANDVGRTAAADSEMKRRHALSVLGVHQRACLFCGLIQRMQLRSAIFYLQVERDGAEKMEESGLTFGGRLEKSGQERKEGDLGRVGGEGGECTRGE